MRQIKQIMIAAALCALVILAGISFPNSSQAFAKYSVKAKHKHALVRHKVKGKHQEGSFQTLVKSESENEYGADGPPDAWFLHIPDSLRASWDKYDREVLLKKERYGILGGTGSPLDTVAVLGPFHQGGITTGLLVSSANPNIYFACSPIGGLWKSTNMGALWLPLDTPAIQYATCIAENPLNYNTIYVSSAGAYFAGVVYKSTNEGNTFSSTSGQAGYSIACDRVDVNTVYSGAWGTNGLQRSTDGGSTWSTVGGTSGSNIWDILALPAIGAAPDPVFIVEQNNGVYYAANGKTATSFTKITPSVFPTTVYHCKLSNCSSSPNTIYAAFDNSTGITNFCKSTDGGITWAAQTIPSGVGTNQWTYPIMLGVSNSDPNRVVCEIQSASYSTDGGTTWGTASMNHVDGHSYANFPGLSTKFLNGSDGGIATNNWGRNPNGWDSIKYVQFDTALAYNYITTYFYGGDFAPNYGKRCIGGLQDNGTWRIRLNEIDSATMVGGGDGVYGHISQQDSNTAYFSDNSNPLHKSTNFFSTSPSWITIAPQWGTGETWAPMWPFQINYADGQQLYVPSTQGVWRTTDGGGTGGSGDWARLNSANIAGIAHVGCTAVTNPSIYFDGYNGTRHFYRIDNAQTAPANGTPVDLSAGLGNTHDPMGEISVYPVTTADPATLYIGFQGTST
jgi:hypothetical protein